MAFISKKQFGFLLLFSMGTCMLTLFLILEFHTMPRAREVQTSANVARLQEAIDAYHADTGTWPPQEPRELLRVLQGQGGVGANDAKDGVDEASQQSTMTELEEGKSMQINLLEEPTAEGGEQATGKNYFTELEIIQDAGQAVDIWRQPLLVEFQNERLRVFSAGKDKKPRTEDDLDGSLWQEELEKRGN